MANHLNVHIGLRTSGFSLSSFGESSESIPTLLISSDSVAIQQIQEKIANAKHDETISASHFHIGSVSETAPWYSYNDKRLNGNVCIDRWKHSFPNVKLLGSENRNYTTLSECLGQWKQWLEYREDAEECSTVAELFICEGDPFAAIDGGKDVLRLFASIRVEGACTRISDIDCLDDQLRHLGFVRSSQKGLQWLRDEQLTLIADMRSRLEILSQSHNILQNQHNSLKACNLALEAERESLELIASKKSEELSELAVIVNSAQDACSLLHAKCDAIQLEKSEICIERDKLLVVVNDLQESSSFMRLQRDESIEAVRDLNARISALEDILRNSDDSNNALTLDLRSAISRSDELDNELKVAQSNVTALQGELSSLRAELVETVDQKNRFQAQADDAKCSIELSKDAQLSLEKTNQELVERHHSLSLEQSSISQELLAANKKCDLLVLDAEKLRDDLLASVDTTSKLRTENQRLHEVISGLRQEKEAFLANREELIAQNTALEASYFELQAFVKELEGRLSSAEDVSHRLSVANQDLEEKIRIEASSSSDLSATILESKHRIESLEDENLKCQDEIINLSNKHGLLHVMLREALGDDTVVPHDQEPVLFLADIVVSHRLQLARESHVLNEELATLQMNHDLACRERDEAIRVLDQRKNCENSLETEISRLHSIITELRDKVQDLLAQRATLNLHIQESQALQSKLQAEMSALKSDGMKVDAELLATKNLLAKERALSTELGLAASEFQSMTKASDAHLSYIQQLFVRLIKDQCFTPSLENGIVCDEV